MARPVAREEVVEEDVADDACVMAVLRNQHAAERGDGRVAVGEGVDGAMLTDPLRDRRREAIVQRAFDEVAREVADQRLGRPAGEEQMRQVIRTFMLSLLLIACSARAPQVERVAFETSKGTFVVEAHRDWAPHAFDRFHELVASRFFDGARFFRVRAGFIVQFGIPGDPKLAQQWEHRTMPDDPVRQTNSRGTIAFASLPEANSRTTQIFINLADNARLDPQGFAPFARVVSGMDVVDALYSGYGETSGGGMRGGHQQKLFAGGNAYLVREFPKLDFIVRADFVGSPARTGR